VLEAILLNPDRLKLCQGVRF